MFQQIGPEIWLSDGPEVTAAMGFHYPTRMVVIRLEDGGLVLWSPIPVTPDLCASVDLLGPVRHIVAPNHLHHLSVADWIQLHPHAQFHAAPGLGKKRPDLRVDAELGAQPSSAFVGQLDQVLVDNQIAPEIVFFHRISGTVLFTDLLQQLPQGWFSGWRALVAWLDGMSGDEPAVPRKFRLAITDRHAARAQIQQVLDWPVQQVVMAHGRPVTSDAKGFLKRAFRWLIK
jgi:hypothetical protein